MENNKRLYGAINLIQRHSSINIDEFDIAYKKTNSNRTGPLIHKRLFYNKLGKLGADTKHQKQLIRPFKNMIDH